MPGKSNLILEIVWLITGFLCLAAGFRYLLNGYDRRILIFVLMAVVSFLFAWYRHRQRKKR